MQFYPSLLSIYGDSYLGHIYLILFWSDFMSQDTKSSISVTFCIAFDYS